MHIKAIIFIFLGSALAHPSMVDEPSRVVARNPDPILQAESACCSEGWPIDGGSPTCVSHLLLDLIKRANALTNFRFAGKT